MVLAMTVCATPDTGSQLGISNGIIGAVIGFDPGDQTIFYMHPEKTSAPAIVGGAADSYDFILVHLLFKSI
jgi:hypothetical protein